MSTLLFEAVKANQSLQLRTLLQEGADPDARDETGETPLTWAAHLGHTAVVKHLLAAGVDVEAVGRRFKAPPLVLAARIGARGVVALLAVHADLDAQDAAGATALMRAVERPEDLVKPQRQIAAIIRTLLDLGAVPDIKDFEGNTALMWAVRWDNAEAVRLLAAAGADLTVRNHAGESALDLADAEGDTEMLRLIRDLEK